MRLLVFSAFLLSAILCRSQNILTVDGILYLINDDHAMIGRQDKNLEGNIVIPESIEWEGISLPVTGLVDPTDVTYWTSNTMTCEGGAFQNCKIESISLPSTISVIPRGTFYGCTALKEIDLPESVIGIGDGAFAECINLEDITLGSNISEIGWYTFGKCQSLSSIILPENLKYIKSGAFKNSGLNDIEIPGAVISLDDECFNIAELKEVKVHFRSIQQVSCSKIAFPKVEECTLYIPAGTLSIFSVEEPWSNFGTIVEFGDGEIVDSDKISYTVDGINYMLYKSDRTAQIWRQNGKAVGDVVIPEYISFEGDDYIVNSIVQPVDMTSYSDGSIKAKGGAFQGSLITSITLPSSIRVISVGAFQDCYNLTDIVLPSELEIIEAGAFANCYDLKSIDLPESVTDLGSASFGYGYRSFVFGNCRSLEKVVLPGKLTCIAAGCFKNSGIKEIEIPKDVVFLDQFSLQCPDLVNMTIHIQDPTTISYSESTFGNVSECNLYVPLGCKSLYCEFYPWIDFKSIDEIDDGREPFVSDKAILHLDDVRYILYPDKTAVIARQNKDLNGDILLRAKIVHEDEIYIVSGFVEPSELIAWSSNSVTTEGGAFQDCDITSIYIPDGISFIPPGTFSNCRYLSEVNLPESLITIGAAAFSDCTSLEEIFIPENVENLGCDTEYGFKSFVFGGCSALKKVNIPGGIKVIPEACFKKSGLNSFLISEQLVRLEPDCFTLPNLEYVKIEHSDFSNIQYTESIFPPTLSNVVLLVPEGAKELYSNFYPWKNFKDIEEYTATDDEYHFNAYGLTTEIIVEDSETSGDPVPGTESCRESVLYSGTVEDNKIYLPSGKEIEDLEKPVVDGLEFLGWENLPSYMPSSDFVLKAKFRRLPTSVIDGTYIDEPVCAKEIYTLDGKKVTDNSANLAPGVYIVRQGKKTSKFILHP